MNNDWLDFLMDMDMEEFDNFVRNTNCRASISIEEKTKKDYTWISVVEKYLPFVKVTMALQLIIDPEEMQKNYENRFLYTVFYRLKDFVGKQRLDIEKIEKEDNFSSLKLDGTTDLAHEKVEVHIELQSTPKVDKDMKSYGLTEKERIVRIDEFLKPIEKSSFVKAMEGASFVRNPIRRTPTIINSNNFKKIVELNEFLESYTMLEKTVVSLRKEQKPEHLLIPYFMMSQYLANQSNLSFKNEEFLKKYLEGFVKKLVEESTLDEKEFKKLINKIYEDELTKKKTREKNISGIYDRSIENYQKQVKDALRALKS